MKLKRLSLLTPILFVALTVGTCLNVGSWSGSFWKKQETSGAGAAFADDVSGFNTAPAPGPLTAPLNGAAAPMNNGLPVATPANGAPVPTNLQGGASVPSSTDPTRFVPYNSPGGGLPGSVPGGVSPNSYATPGSIGNPAGMPVALPTPSAPLGGPSNVPVQAPANIPASQAPPAASNQSAPAADPTALLEDYTNKLRLAPGLTLLFPIQNGCDRNGRPLPPYSMAVQIEKRAKDCAFSYKWTMSELNATGVRAVDEAAKRNSRKVSFFYKPGEQCTLVGYTNAVRVSDAMYRDLKSGVSSPIELDGPFGQATRHAPSIPLPQNIAKTGEEDLVIQVDEKKVKVHTIKAVGDNPPGIAGSNSRGGWTYWIMDNANFPMIVQGSGPFNWEAPIINSNGTIGNGGDIGGAGTKEGKRIVKDLKKNGVATTNAILFDFDSDKLKPSATPILNEVSSYLRSAPAVKLGVQGHCDNVGGMDYNMNLSRRRAKSVSQYLVNSGVSTDRLQSAGFGFTRPVASNKTAAGRAKNRRVVFKVQ